MLMKKKVCIIILSFTFVLSCLGIFGCDNKQDYNSGTGLEVNTRKRYEFDLTLENFNYFFNYLINSLNTQVVQYDIVGVLSFAYYENVEITFDVNFKYDMYGANKYYTGKYIVNLNAAGCYSFKSHDSELLTLISCPESHAGVATKRIDVESITGKIIFSI